MSTRQTIKISVLSNLLTVGVVIGLLAGIGPVLARNPEVGPVQPPDPAFPDSSAAETGGHEPWLAPEAAAAGEVYLHIAGSTFIPMYWDTKPVYDYGGCTYGDATALPGRVIYNLPVVLPPGSTINSLRFYYKDTSASNSMVRLRAMADGQGLVDVTALSSDGDAGYGSAAIALNHVVDYEHYSYVIQWYGIVAGPSMELCGVRIGYTPPSIFGVALPLVTKEEVP